MTQPELDLFVNELSDNLPASFDSCIDLLTYEMVQAVEEWEDPYPGMFSVTMNNPNSKYLASSAFQKCLRRGFVERAVFYAEAIFNSDVQDYLWNRLPLVVLEDIGLGNWKFCAYAIHFCRFSRVRNKFNQLKALHWIVHHLAAGTKSRSLSEAVCLGYFCEGDEKDISEEILYVGDCMKALGWKPGYEDRPNSPWHTRMPDFSKLEMYREVAQLTEDHPEKMYIRYCFHSGNKKNVAYQNAATAHVLRLQQTSVLDAVYEHVVPPFKKLHKYPDVAYDKHTLEGKKALGWILKSGKLPFQGITLRQLGLCIFQVESALIDKELTSEGLLAMQRRSQDYEIVQVGMSVEDGNRLKEFLLSDEGVRLLYHYRSKVL